MSLKFVPCWPTSAGMWHVIVSDLQPGLGTSQQISDFIFEFEWDYSTGLPGSLAYVLDYSVIANISHYLSLCASLSPLLFSPDHSLTLFSLRSLTLCIYYFVLVSAHVQTHVLRKCPINRRHKFLNVTYSKLF